jgi:ATP-dependent DNA ligase
MLPGIFENTVFTQRRGDMTRSSFLRPMHPKAEIRPTPDAIRKVLSAGWVGQLKIHGHRAQIHIPADASQEVYAYNRQGQIHKKTIPPHVLSELFRIFKPKQGWNVIDAEWMKADDKLYVFDFLKCEGEMLHRMTYQERWSLLPRAYLSPSFLTLGLLSTLEQCLHALERPEPCIEGLVFKSSSPGFEDSSILRCRR